MIFGKVLRMMSHLGGGMRMIAQVARPQNHSKKKKQSKSQINQKKKKRAKIQAVTCGELNNQKDISIVNLHNFL